MLFCAARLLGQFGQSKVPTDSQPAQSDTDDSAAPGTLLTIRCLRLASASGISSIDGAVAEWLKAAVC
jgi:hypothetical protein